MIPLKLQLKNFVSYGSNTQTIDFSPYNLICLSGKNGHGKSALLDAITWVLWGQARKINGASKADDGLIRLGQTQMMVCLDFICNTIIYRVRREYNIQGSKAVTHVEFGIIEPHSNIFRPLTDKTIRSTQEKIESMIGLDYNSFINSAFLRQGQANEFSKKAPKDRKEILASILGLEQFERIRKRAYDKAKEAHTHKDHTQRALEIAAQELQQKPVINEQLECISTQLHTLQEQEKNYKFLLQDIKLQQQHMGQAKIAYEQRLFELSKITETIQQFSEAFTQAVHIYRAIMRNVKKLYAYSQQQEQINGLKIELDRLHKQKYALFSLKEKHLELKQTYTQFTYKLQQAQQQELEKQKISIQQAQATHMTAEHKIQELVQERCKQEEFFIQTQILHKQLLKKQDLLSYEIISLSQQEKQFERRKEYYHTFSAQAQALETELKNIEHKKVLTHHSSQPACPLCQQCLSPELKQDLCSTLEKQESFFYKRLQRLKKITIYLKDIIFKQHAQLEKIKNAQQEHTKYTVRIDEIYKQKLTIQESIANLDKTVEHIQSEFKLLKEQIKAQELVYSQTQLQASIYIESHTERIQLQKELLIIEKNIEITTYSSEQETNIQEKLTLLQQEEHEYRTLLKESALQEQRKQNISNLHKEIKIAKQQQILLQKECAQKVICLEQEQKIQQQEEFTSLQLHKLSQEKEHIILQKGALEQLALLLEQRDKEFKLQQEFLTNLTKTEEEYSAIATALSKDGIQALLIEDAIPEIEQEANTLLAKLTDNQAQLTIDSLRDLRNGNTKETLDIKISDAIGIRPYELFSGGEAFRIDFALRIAISKLLARRAGTSLQTLIIDEGFGSQDEDGLHNIMEAIYKIQDDFAKIIIVSHLPTMKDQFPVHFLVQKNSQGSTVKVIQNG